MRAHGRAITAKDAADQRPGGGGALRKLDGAALETASCPHAASPRQVIAVIFQEGSRTGMSGEVGWPDAGESEEDSPAPGAAHAPATALQNLCNHRGPQEDCFAPGAAAGVLEPASMVATFMQPSNLSSGEAHPSGRTCDLAQS